MNKILIVKTSALGDITHTYPVIDYLRKKFPAVQIDWVVEAPFVDLVKFHPGVDHVLNLSTKVWRKQLFSRETVQSISAFRKQLRKECYDVIFDFQGNIKSGLILSQARGVHKVGFGKASVSEWPNMLFTNYRINVRAGDNIRQDYLSLVASFFNEGSKETGGVKLNLETAVQDNKVMQDFDSESLSVETDHSEKVKAVSIRSDYSSKDCVNLLSSIAVFRLKISQEQQAAIEAVIQKSKRPIVMVCPGSAWRNKQLTTETLASFLDLLRDYLSCYFLFVWGSAEEKQMVEKLHTEFAAGSQIVDKMSLPMLQNMMVMSNLVIAMDSLPLHLAGTTGTPTFSVFGASSAAKYKPPGNQHYAFQGSCPYGRSFEKRCPILRTCPTGACIREVKAAELFEAFKAWWIGVVA